MVQHLEDGVPIAEQLHRQGVGLGVGMALVLRAGGMQVGQEASVLGRQIGRRTFARAYTAAISAFRASRIWRPKARTSRW